uniref:HpcH/HpaI aldolase/citrate lyase family protein n=1 Tax=Candidatus Kentrum sp. UNK TaxID=2126344 RepID=A0A451AVK5_9GAMM|nr:MAG: HpcH/HpaI aldolase/citrate lyase family protein [Candidatus Kentron sp. UNK]VFK70073.1 MAG: HpcH/HpaI aldolase/citrate lyase family protein [Candidatus Kentron sp. UNK]
MSMTDLQGALRNLKSRLGLIFLKAGTEWEDMDYSEIEYLYSLGEKKIPMLVKISGPEAKTDLRHLEAIGVTGLLGPMIESEYALEKFVATTTDLYDDSPLDPMLAINIETIDGYRKLDAIMSNPAFGAVRLVIIGRLDLSQSMHIEDVDHPEVTTITRDLANRLRRAGKHVSIGGFVNPSSADALRDVDADRVNTLHALFDLNRIGDASAAVRKAIEFEIAYYDSLLPINPTREAFYRSRMEISRKKLEKANART